MSTSDSKILDSLKKISEIGDNSQWWIKLLLKAVVTPLALGGGAYAVTQKIPAPAAKPKAEVVYKLPKSVDDRLKRLESIHGVRK